MAVAAEVAPDRTIHVVARAEAGSGNCNAVGKEKAVGNVISAVNQAVQQARDCSEGRQVHVDAICLSTAGVDREGDEVPFQVGLENAGLASTSSSEGNGNRKDFGEQALVKVVNDAHAALASGVLGSDSSKPMEGIVLIVGTGTIAFGVRRDGQTARVSGWGPAFSDTGSGYDIGHRALSAAARHHDGRGEKTDLTSRLIGHLELSTPDELITWAYSRQGWAPIASLAPLVFSAASDGDAVAKQIVSHCAAELVRCIDTLESRLFCRREGGDEPPPVVLVGGIMANANVLSDKVQALLLERNPKQSIVLPSCEAAIGAAALAAKLTTKETQTNEAAPT